MINEIKISFKEPKYEVNKEKGTVECYLRYEVLYPKSLQGIFFWAEKIYFYAHGVAKVNSGDVFDENIGKKISLAKAEKKAYAKIRKRLIKRMTNEINNAIHVANDFINKAYNVIKHNDKYLEQWQ
jgi:hypothetical protein